MGSGDWFRALICLRKAKQDRSKKVKVHSTSEKSNGVEDVPDSDAHIESTTSAPVDEARNDSIPQMSAEYKAAVRIQTAFRTYFARKSLRKLKGAERFNVLIQGNDTQKQATSTINHIHLWSYIQGQIRDRRHHMVTEGRIKQKKMENQLKLEAKLQELEVEWNGSSDTMEEILSRIQQREEAAVKRERAMAYAFSHQWRANPTQYLGHAYYSIGKENWGWSWKERWVAARPWEIRVQAQPSYQKIGHCKQASKSDLKLTVLTTPTSSNGKAGIKCKTKADHQAVEEAIV